jgi:iron complex outermembrane receptor protein
MPHEPVAASPAHGTATSAQRAAGHLFHVFLLACLAFAPARAGAQAVDPLKTLSIEELMEVDVTSVSRGREPFAQAAAAIDIITAEDIRRSGVTTLPEALRLATGLMVGRAHGGTWAVSARGFTTTTANKLLVLIDGRSVYTPLFSGVFWDVQDVSLEDIERIEVIRGPGATLWGANAVNGVINVITRPAARTLGGQVQAGAGNEERLFGTVRYGDEIGTLQYRAYGKYSYLDANVTGGGESARDRLGRLQTGGRLEWALSEATQVTLQGDGYAAAVGNYDRPDTDAWGWNLLARLERQFSPTSELQVQAYYDRTSRSIPSTFVEDRGTWDIEIQYRTRPSRRHALLVGGSYRLTRDTTGVPFDPGLARGVYVTFDPPRRSSPLASAFAQDDITVVPGRLFVTVGARLEHNDFTGAELQPTFRARFVPRAKALLWGAVSRAVRTPTRLESDVRYFTPDDTMFLRGDPTFDSERVVAYELGYRVQPLTRVSVDVAAFRNEYDRLRSVRPGPPAVIANGLRGHSTGLETEVQVQATPWMRWQGSWSWFTKDLELVPGEMDVNAGAGEGNDPEHQFGLRAALNLPRGVELDAGLRQVGALPRPIVPAYTELDFRIGWWVSADAEVSFIGRNLLNGSHPEFRGANPGGNNIERSVYGRLRLAF